MDERVSRVLKVIFKYKYYKYLAIVAVLILFAYGGFNVLIFTNKTGFCAKCHSMRYNYNEYKQSVHYKSPSGVRAECADCHVPHGVGALAVAKMFAVKDIWAELTKDTGEKETWDKERPRLAKIVREKFLKSDSGNCRRCHKAEALVPTKIQGQNAHEKMKTQKKTCIDCHYNLVHQKVPWPEKEKVSGELEGLF
ncbi:MAG: NapC/NirT family cytochrome c [Deltaproteobacteria bacterium]|nr:NapC/NirT family cytochrome c [Deltaproteobacteria bacterium]